MPLERDFFPLYLTPVLRRVAGSVLSRDVSELEP